MAPEEHLAAALAALGFDRDPECEGTAARVAELLREFGPDQPAPELATFPAPAPDVVVLRDLPFHSLCAHHLLPFFGTATVAYRPTARIAGLGAIARALRHFARRPQLQERLGASLADHLSVALAAPVGVRLVARQLCMEMRGAESAGTVESFALRGSAGVEPAPEDLRELRELLR